jgi:hypothetical protein
MTRTTWWCDVKLTAKASILALLAIGAAAGGCVDKERREKKIDPAYIKKNLLAAPPASIQNRVDADLGGYVTYLGNDADKTTVAPGGTVTVVHYWKVVAPPGPEWRVFSHVVGSSAQWMNVDRTDMRLGYPPGDWKAGDIIRDEQKFTLDADWKSPYAQLVVGLYRKGSHGPEGRMRIERGPADDESRLLAIRFSVARGAGQRTPPAPPYLVRRARGPITVDGKADEVDWKSASEGPPFVAAEGGGEVKGAAHARLLWDDSNLYAFIQVDDPDVASQYRAQDDPLWKEDVVELFIDADRNRRGYVELQVNPRNAHFDAWFPETRAQANHPEWTSKMKSAVVVRGTLDERGDQDQGWDAEIAIPLADVKGADAAMKVTIPPAVGDSWRLNAVRVDKPADGKLTASSWSAIPIADFHALGRMLTVVFADEEGAARPAAGAAAAPGAAAKPADGAGAAAGKPADKPAAKPADKPAAKPADKPAAKPADKPAGKSGGKPAKGAAGD